MLIKQQESLAPTPHGGGSNNKDVCGTDGLVYSTLCDLKKAACHQQKFIVVASRGFCGRSQFSKSHPLYFKFKFFLLKTQTSVKASTASLEPDVRREPVFAPRTVPQVGTPSVG